jgi:hypothetical protein
MVLLTDFLMLSVTTADRNGILRGGGGNMAGGIRRRSAPPAPLPGTVCGGQRLLCLQQRRATAALAADGTQLQPLVQVQQLHAGHGRSCRSV